MTKFVLPRKIAGHRLRLHAHYLKNGEKLLADLISKSSAYVVEETSFDNWNGGTYGHDLQLFLRMEDISRVDISDIESLEKRICEDLNSLCSSLDNEFFATVHLDLFDEYDANCQHAKPFSSQPEPDATSLSIWRPGMVRLFISHRDQNKEKANALARLLEPYGISSFVAHDSIEPMTIWQSEILRGLETMEIMLAFVTNGFHESVWTNQEIGFAIGRNVPIVSLKLQDQDPKGFIGNQQALKCAYDDLVSVAPRIYALLAERLGSKERLQSSVIRAFLNAPNFDEAKWRFERMKSVVDELSDAEFQDVVEGFRRNNQLHNSIYLNNKYKRLANFIRETIGRDVVIDGAEISTLDDDREIPF